MSEIELWSLKCKTLNLIYQTSLFGNDLPDTIGDHAKISARGNLGRSAPIEISS